MPYSLVAKKPQKYIKSDVLAVKEVDFVINYDIKYRMGRDGGGAEEDQE